MANVSPINGVAVPDRMKHLPVDRRGYPIPHVVMRDTDGRPHFTINDQQVVLQAVHENRCAICGNPLDKLRWYVGGPGSTLHEHGVFFDTPLHADCARYALQVCPWLAAPRYAHRIDDKTLDPSKMPAHLIGTEDRTQIPNRPLVFVLLSAFEQQVLNNGRDLYIKPQRPFRSVEFWKHGHRLEPDDPSVRAVAARSPKDQQWYLVPEFNPYTDSDPDG